MSFLSSNSRLDHKKVKVFRILLFLLNPLSMPVCNPYSSSYIPLYLTLFRHEKKKKIKEIKRIRIVRLVYQHHKRNLHQTTLLSENAPPGE